MNAGLPRLLEVLNPHGGAVVVMFEGYFDESGDFEAVPKVFCISGYFMRQEDAKALDSAWQQVLDEYELPYFHMVDCAHGNPPFEKLKEEGRCVEAEKRFIDLIKKYTLEGFSVVANGDHFDPTPEDPDIYSTCVSACLSALDVFLKSHRIDGQIAYFFESGHKNKGRAYSHVAAQINKSGASLTFADKKQIRLLQAADLLAWQTTKYVKDRLSRKRPPRKDFMSLMEHPHVVMHTQHTGGQKLMGIEAFPLSRRSHETTILNGEYDGPLPLFMEQGEDIPIIPVNGSFGYRIGGGRMAYIAFEAMGGKPFYLSFDQMRLQEAIICLIGATDLYTKDGCPPAKADEISLIEVSGRHLLGVKLPSGLTLTFSVPEEAVTNLAATLNKLKPNAPEASS